MINIPTTNELYVQMISALETELNINIPASGKSAIRAIAAVQAAKLKLYYLAVMNVQKNIFVDTADPEAIGGTLERFGFVKLGRYPFQATAGKYQLNVSGTVGSVLSAGTIFKSDDDALSPGQLYTLDTAYTMPGGTGTIEVRALETGLDSQLSPGDTLSLTAPIAGVDTTATVYIETTEPVAAEDIEDYRQKAIQAYQLEPQGGSGSDYRLWAADAQGVEQSYPYAVAGNSNQINLFVEATTVDSTDGKGTPTAAILTAVQSAVEDPTTERPGRKPLGVFIVNYEPVNVLDVDITIDSFVDNTADKQADILSSITTAINQIRPYIGSIEPLANKNDILDTNLVISKILEAVPGSTFGSITLNVDGSPVSTYTFTNGEIPFLNSISYT